MGHNLAILIMQNLLFKGLYGIDMDVIHLLVLFEHRCYVHCLYMNVICLFILFWHQCCVSIHTIYTQKSWTQQRFPYLNNVWLSCVNDINPWNNKFHTNLERTYEAYKFVMLTLSQPYFGWSGRMKLPLPKLEIWSPLGLPNV